MNIFMALLFTNYYSIFKAGR